MEKLNCLECWQMYEKKGEMYCDRFKNFCKNMTEETCDGNPGQYIDRSNWEEDEIHSYTQ